jgi:hypothetical protein
VVKTSVPTELNRWMETLDDQVSALAASRRWKIGDALVSLPRKALRKPKEPVVTSRWPRSWAGSVPGAKRTNLRKTLPQVGESTHSQPGAPSAPTDPGKTNAPTRQALSTPQRAPNPKSFRTPGTGPSGASGSPQNLPKPEI